MTVTYADVTVNRTTIKIADIVSVSFVHRAPPEVERPKLLPIWFVVPSVFVDILLLPRLPRTANTVLLCLEAMIGVGVVWYRLRPTPPLAVDEGTYVVAMMTNYGSVELATVGNKGYAERMVEAVNAALDEERARREAHAAEGAYR